MKRTFALLLLCLFTAAAGCHVQQLRTAPEKEDPAASGIVQEQPQLPDGVMPEAPWNEEKKEPELTQEKEQTVFITAEESYFSDAVFIGASRLEGLALYAPIQGRPCFIIVGSWWEMWQIINCIRTKTRVKPHWMY